jgi:hypothetical protein
MTTPKKESTVSRECSEDIVMVVVAVVVVGEQWLINVSSWLPAQLSQQQSPCDFII